MQFIKYLVEPFPMPNFGRCKLKSLSEQSMSKKKYYHKKLVRDKIPEIIESFGDSYKTRILDIREYRRQLRKKLIEEAKESVSAKKSELAKELSDVSQVIKSIADFEGIPLKDIEAKRKDRERKRGAFKKRIYLIWSNKPAGKK